MMNCKPGDLAIVIGANLTPEMIGCIVEVIRPSFFGDVVEGFLVGTKGNSWVVTTQSSRGIPVRSLQGNFYCVSQRVISDSNLRQISGIHDTEDTDIEQPIKEVA